MIEKWSLHAVNECFEIIYNTAGAENRLEQRSHFIIIIKKGIQVKMIFYLYFLYGYSKIKRGK